MNTLNTHPSGRPRRGLAGIIILLVSYLLIASGCSTTPTTSNNTTAPAATSASTPTAAPTTTTNASGQPIMLQDIHMVDAQKGWAISHDKQHVLYTTSSGTQWHDVTPHTGWPQYTLSTSTFLDASHAWVTLQTDTNKISIFRTFDSGQLWQETPLTDQGTGIAQISFVDQQNGWLLLNKGAAMGHEAIDILHTTDGGATWLKTSSADETTENQPGTIPFSGDKSGMSFLNSTTGWITGSIPVNNHVWLYVTHDGGSTWQAQNLPLPPNSNVQVATMPPTFFNSTDGIMPVTIFDGNNKLSIYTTHDGGKSWQASTVADVPPDAVSFVDLNHGWAAGSNNNAFSIFSTSNGGQNWTALTPKTGSGVTSLDRLDFVSDMTGWALGDIASDSTILLQTTDGGKTWKQVVTTLSDK